MPSRPKEFSIRGSSDCINYQEIYKTSTPLYKQGWFKDFFSETPVKCVMLYITASENNLDYALTLRDSLELNLKKLVSTLNVVPKAQSHEAKIALNTDISNVFEFLLRNQQFFFNCSDLVEEGALSSIKGLNESYMHGFLYHLGIEEELKKINANEIEAKVPKEICEAINTIKTNVALIKEASERAYNINKRIVDLSVFLYTFVKWANGK